MANNITGKVVNEIQFKINKKSWDNLTQFQNKITNIKRQLSGLKGSIKVQAVVSQVNQVTRAVTQGANRIKKAQLDLPHLFPSGKTNSASKTAFADMLRSEKKQADQRERLIQKQALSEERAAERLNRKLQRLDESRIKSRNRIEQQIAYREQGARFAFQRRELGADPTGKKLLGVGRQEAMASIANANRELRQGSITLREYNQKVNNAVQSQMRMARVNAKNALSMRDVRTELVQLTAAYSAFALGANIFRTGKELQSLEAGMLIFAGDKAGVRENMQFLIDESDRLGTNFMVAAEQYTKFATVASRSMSKAQTREIFTAFSEIATTQQMDGQRFHRGMNALMQMMSKGQLMAEEVKGQLT